MSTLNRIIFWSARSLAVAFILFLSLFSLDVFEMWGGMWDTILGLLVHNIPGFILATVITVAWRRPVIGAVGYALAGIVYAAIVSSGSPDLARTLSWSLVIAGPAWLIAGLFLTEWIRQKKTDE